MTEREAGTEIIMRLSEQSLELEWFIKEANKVLFFSPTRHPKILKQGAQGHKVLIIGLKQNIHLMISLLSKRLL